MVEKEHRLQPSALFKFCQILPAQRPFSRKFRASQILTRHLVSQMSPFADIRLPSRSSNYFSHLLEKKQRQDLVWRIFLEAQFLPTTLRSARGHQVQPGLLQHPSFLDYLYIFAASSPETCCVSSAQVAKACLRKSQRRPPRLSTARQRQHQQPRHPPSQLRNEGSTARMVMQKQSQQRIQAHLAPER